MASHPELGDYTLSCEGAPELLFTENESNAQKLWGQPNPTPYVKDAFHRYVISGERDAVNPAKTGTKAAARYVLEVPAGGCQVVQLRLAAGAAGGKFGARFDETLRQRLADADEFYDADHAALAERGRAPRPPPGARGDAVDEAVLLLRRRPLAEGAPGASAPSAARAAASATPSGSTC